MVLQLRQHGAIGGGRREAHARPVPGDGLQEVVRTGPLQEDRGRADPQGKQHDPSEPEREGERRRADEAVARLGPEDVGGIESQIASMSR